uniref:Pentatricopeptide repeat-containing protein n=1 Tax=Nelumbo nucifera TaxID=4432 RepID=A0A822YXF4_NELNU|nr:TPA_asm: hypothetical protein HUJ06_008003 [Nelumbo nucifera]
MRMQTRSLLSFARLIAIVVIPKPTTRASLLELDGSYHVGVFSCNQTIDNLIKCGNLDSTVEMFEAMPVRDVVSYNLVIADHARHGKPSSSLHSGFSWVQRKLVCWVRTD